ADGAAEVAEQVTMSGADILQRVAAVEVLRPRCEIDPFGTVAAVVEIIWIVVVEHRVNDINIDPTNPIDHAYQPLQTDPRVVMDGDLESLLHGRPRQGGATPCVRQTDSGVPLPGGGDPHITRPLA